MELSRGLISSEEALAETLELAPAILAFVGIPLQHSEALADHDLALSLLDAQERRHPGAGLGGFRSFYTAHRDVIVRFGRYPHRNAKLGRQTTPDEQAWLNDVDNLPNWAK